MVRGLMDPASKRAVAPVWVGAPAARWHPRHARPPAPRDLFNVIELEELPRCAAPPGPAHERALPAVSLPDRTLDLGRDVARIGLLAPALARVLSPGELALLELLDQSLAGQA